MPCFSTPSRLSTADLDAVDQLRPLLGRLHVARRELRLRRDEGDRARASGLPASVTQRGRLPELQARHDAARRTKTLAHAWSRSVTTTSARAAPTISPASASFCGHDAGDRRRDAPRRRGSCRATAICASTVATRARAAVDFLRRARRPGAAPAPPRAARTRSPRRAAAARAPRPAACGHRRAASATRRSRGGATRSARDPPPRLSSSASAARDVGCAPRRPAPAAWRTSSARAPARSRRSWAAACCRSAAARSSSSSASRVSRRAMTAPRATRSPSFAVSSTSRPPTSGATRTSVASTYPEARARSRGAAVPQAPAKQRSRQARARRGCGTGSDSICRAW